MLHTNRYGTSKVGLYIQIHIKQNLWKLKTINIAFYKDFRIHQCFLQFYNFYSIDILKATLKVVYIIILYAPFTLVNYFTNES